MNMLRHRHFRYAFQSRLKVVVALAAVWCALPHAASARASGPPPMICERSIGSDLARQVEKVMIEHAASPGIADAKIKKLLAQGMSSGGLRYKYSFPRGIYFDATRRDVRKVITNLMRANKHNWVGYMRELKYINELASPESPFVLEKAGGREVIKDGRLVEFDLLVRDKRSSLKMAIEVKEWKIRSSADLEKAKGQIRKIAMRAKQERVERVIWVNREKVPAKFRADLEECAIKNNAGFYDNISTSQRLERNLTNQRRFDDVLEKESRYLGRIKWGRVAGRSLAVAGILWETGQAVSTIHKWRSGRMTDRELVAEAGGTAGGLAGGIAGGWAGAKAGAVVGSFFGPGPGTAIGAFVGGAFGAVGGGIAGCLAGTAAATTASDKLIFQQINDEEKQKIFDVLNSHYQAVSTP